jgi:hypothetical protein
MCYTLMCKQLWMGMEPQPLHNGMVCSPAVTQTLAFSRVSKSWDHKGDGNGLPMVLYTHPLHMNWFIHLIPLKSIFHCSMIEESTNSQNGKICWLCKWCGKMFSPRHQSRALCHVLKIRCGDIAICIARIPKFYKDRYQADRIHHD